MGVVSQEQVRGVAVVSWEQAWGVAVVRRTHAPSKGGCSSGQLDWSHLGMWVHFCQIFWFSRNPDVLACANS